MLRNSLSTKISVIFIGCAFALCVALVITAAQLAGSVANEQADKALLSATVGKRKAVEMGLQQVRDSVGFFTTLPTAKDSIMKMRAGWKNLKENQTAQLRKIYVDDNPNAAGARHLMKETAEKNYYTNSHALVHQEAADLIAQHLFRDLALADPDGNIVYTYRKDEDFGRAFDDPAMAGMAIQAAMTPLMEAAKAGTLKASDLFFSGFDVNEAGNVSAVLATPIFYLDKFFGAVAFSIDMERFSALLNDKTGIGESERSMLATPDGSLVQFTKEGGARSELKLSDVRISDNELDIDGADWRFKASAATFLGHEFTVIEAVEQAELSAAASRITNGVTIAGIICLIPFAGLIWWLTKRMFAPLVRLSSLSRRIAEGELDTEVGGVQRADEIGEMARSVDIFRNNSLERERLSRESAAGEIERKKRAEAIDALISGFRAEVTGVLSNMGEVLDGVGRTATDLAQSSSNVAAQGAEAEQEAERASGNVEAVAAATEELNASIAEIERQVATTADVVLKTTRTTASSNEKVAGLARSVDRIGEVVGLIQAIAEQTNLLALNATIEAARAGEAGRGFAIVASEVKDLAGQTAKATEEISGQIAEIQASTTDAVTEIGAVTESIEEVNGYTEAIAAAVREQGSATSEISHNVSQAADGTRIVNESVSVLSARMGESAAAMDELKATTSVLMERAEQLRASIDHFLSDVAAA